jgi:hypothetical protein
LRVELDAFADSIPRPGHTPRPYPIGMDEMGHGIALFEAIVKSIDGQTHVEVSQ